MFWKHKETQGEVNLPGPKDIPELAGRCLVVEEKKDPDWVWTLKAVVRPAGKKAFYCRVFDQAQATRAGVNIKDWDSLEGHPDLVLWEGYFDRETNVARREKFVKPAQPGN